MGITGIFIIEKKKRWLFVLTLCKALGGGLHWIWDLTQLHLRGGPLFYLGFKRLNPTPSSGFTLNLTPCDVMRVPMFKNNIT
jgi:hypothetical protein